MKSNANRRPCAKKGVRGLFNLGQTCYLNVILQTLLHDPILSTYFLGNGHQPHDCTVADCIGCAVAEAFADFNSIDKPEGFAALNLLLASWRASPVGLTSCNKAQTVVANFVASDISWVSAAGRARVLPVPC